MQLPVRDEEGKEIGQVSLTEIAEALADCYFQEPVQNSMKEVVKMATFDLECDKAAIREADYEVRLNPAFEVAINTGSKRGTAKFVSREDADRFIEICKKSGEIPFSKGPTMKWEDE